MRYLLILFALGASPCLFAQFYHTGLNFGDSDAKNIEKYESSAFGFGDELPASTSLREFAPYPGNQGMYGTCVGWSFGYCGLTTLYARQFGIKNRNVITAMAMCPYTIYNNIRSTEDCSMGTELNDAGAFVTSTGSKRFHLRESDCGTTDEFDDNFIIYKADGYSTLWDWSEDGESEEKDKVNKAKNALADGNIVLIGMGVSSSFQSGVNENGEWIKSDLSWENEPMGGHAMCVIGYDDNRLGGTFELQNSWGQDWGDNGYVYVGYDDFQEYVVCAGVMELDDQNKWTDMGAKKGCLFGDCNGQYSRFTFENGDTYEGLVVNGVPNGNGIYIWADGDVYTGDFKDGVKHGKGIYFYGDGTIQNGHWENDEFRADLAYLDYTFGTVDLGTAYFTGYMHSKKWMFGSYNLSYGLKVYEGKFSENGDPDGFGLLVRYGENILGEFKDGAYVGYNAVFNDESWTLYTCENDDCEEAPSALISTTIDEIPNQQELAVDTLTFNNDACSFGTCENGYAHYTYPSGNTYNGFVTNGWRHGYGVYTDNSDSKIKSYEGEYFYGQRNGIGKLIFKDGSVFIGEFAFGKINGRGIWIKKDGKVQAGFWENDEYIEIDTGFGFANSEPLEMNPEAKSGMTGAEKRMPRKFAEPLKLQ